MTFLGALCFPLSREALYFLAFSHNSLEFMLSRHPRNASEFAGFVKRQGMKRFSMVEKFWHSKAELMWDLGRLPYLCTQLGLPEGWSVRVVGGRRRHGRGGRDREHRVGSTGSTPAPGPGIRRHRKYSRGVPTMLAGLPGPVSSPRASPVFKSSPQTLGDRGLEQGSLWVYEIRSWF